ncbi:MAG: ribosome-associated translation inhibitor RaiA [marine benthic group bacterium]|jgi:putative sigma-54 modulation protein|nr:ribosome-associated translation inhibitor RaiA [Candidatus Benthicola marisminoris]
MQIIISARHVELTDSLKEYIEERFSRLSRFDERVSRIDVTVTEEKKRCRVEANVSRGKRPPAHASAETPDFRSSVDRVQEKLTRQLKSRREKTRDRKAAPEFPVAATEIDEL